MTVQRVLTGITTSGTPHLGNYVGAVRPSVQASIQAEVQSFYFLADYHALIKTGDPARVQRSTLEIAATWLAAGLDPERVVFYRQSDIPEIPELTWLLTCVCGKGLLNRAHAYKASVDKNTAAGAEPDDRRCDGKPSEGNQGRTGHLQTVPRKRRPVLLQTASRRWHADAAKHRL